ncbi:hypothetical protein ACSBR2_036528 [Camellia fascicularis]
MNRIQVKKNGMEKYGGSICSTVQQKLESNKEDARNCFASFAGDLKFEVDCYDTTHVVDSKARTYGCRDWDLTGIPCKHTISCIYLTKEKPEAYVHNYFSKETYLRTYSFMINPVPGEHNWIETRYDAITPSYYRKLAGRPRKERKKAADEPKNLHRGAIWEEAKKATQKSQLFYYKKVKKLAFYQLPKTPQGVKEIQNSVMCKVYGFWTQQKIMQSTHPSSSQPATSTQSQPTMPCGASASGFVAPGINANGKAKGLRD